MIDLGRPAFHAEGVTLFPDHAEPGLFHFLPDRPRLRLTPDGLPELSLLKYRLDAGLHEVLGAGLLSLTVDLGVEEERMERLRRRLAAQGLAGARARLAPVAAEAGRCELVLIDRSSADRPADGPGGDPEVGFGLVERILGGAATSLYGDNAALFQAVLSAEAVALVEGAMRGGGLPLGVVYTLETTGLRPALRAEITARWQDAYDFYENRLHGGKLLLATDIGPTLEALVQSEAIRIQVDELVPEHERVAVYQKALDEVQRYILEELFEPSLGQAPPPEDARDDALATIGRAIKDIAGFFSLTYSLREVRREELKRLTYHLGVARAERLTLAPQGTFQAILGPAEEHALDRLILTVEPTAPAEMRFDIGAAIDLAREEIERMDVMLRYGERREFLSVDAATPRGAVTFWFEPELGRTIAYAYEVQFRAGSVGPLERLSAPERDTDARLIRLNPRELYQRLGVRIVAQGLPFDRYPTVLADLRGHDPADGWSAVETLELSMDRPEAAFSLRARLDATVRIERRLRYFDAAGRETVLDWEAIEPGVLVLGDPFPEVVDLAILGSARFDRVVKRIIVELRPHADPERIALRVLSAEQPAANWSFAVRDQGARGYDYRVTLHTALNEIREGTWLPGPPGKLVVGEGIFRVRQVELLFLGRPLAELGLLGLKVRFAFADPEADLFTEDEFLVDDPKKPLRWSYPVADAARQAYTYQLSYIRDTGAIEPQAPVTTADLLVLQPLL